jgi:hypothetical protein
VLLENVCPPAKKNLRTISMSCSKCPKYFLAFLGVLGLRFQFYKIGLLQECNLE